MKNSAKKLFLPLVLLFCLLLGSCSTVPEKSRTEFLLDTFCTITIAARDADSLLNLSFELCSYYEQQFSRTLQGSDIYRINQAEGQPVQVAKETAELINLGIYYGELSDGLLDISIGQLSELWNFGENEAVPAAADIAAALATVDYRNIVVEGNTVTLLNPQAKLDLGAIAKGYIADRLADFLREAGVSSAIINLGGNVVTVGQKQDKTLWNIGISQPFSSGSEQIGWLEVGECSVVTSGIYERNFVAEEKLYHHILDPRTGYPAESDIIGVSIVSQSSAAGDALSTICLILGQQAGSALLEQQQGTSGAVWINTDEQISQSGDINFIAYED